MIQKDTRYIPQIMVSVLQIQVNETLLLGFYKT